MKFAFRILPAMICLIGILYAAPKTAHACTNPAGVAGDSMFNETHNVPVYCDGTDWIAMVGANPTSALSITVPNGLIGYWTLDGNADDLVGSNNGTLVGGASFSAGQVSDAIDLDGSGDYINLGSAAILDNMTLISTCAWVFTRSGSYTSLLDKSTSGTNGWNLYWAGTNGFGFQTPRNGFRERSAGLSTSTWHHLCATWDGTDGGGGITLYLDGALYTGTSAGDLGADLDDSAFDLNIGGNSGSDHDGLMDDVRLYNRELSASEVTDIYNCGISGDCGGPSNITQIVPSGLVGHWRLDETSGTTFADSSGNGNDATIANGLDISTSNVTGVIDTGINLASGGTQEAVDLGNPAELQITGAITVSGWFKQEDNTGPYYISKMTSGNRPYDLSANAGTNGSVVEFRVAATGSCGTGISSGTSTAELDIGEWAFLVGVYEPSSYIRTYINGELAAETTTGVPASICDNTSAVYVGCREDGFCGDGFNGDVDDIRIYNRALSEEEITKLYNARDGIRFNDAQRSMEFFDGNRWVSMTPPFPEPQKTFGYVPNAVVFDGTNDILESSTLSGVSDSKMLTGSFWINSADNTVRRRLWNSYDAVGPSGGQIFSFENNDTMTFAFENESGTDTLNLNTTSVLTENEWHHVLFSFDMNSTSNRHIYINDAAALGTINTYIDDVLNFDGSSFRVGSGGGAGVDKYPGSVADFWLEFGTYIDFSVEANRRLFIDANGNPVNLGTDGSNPTGSAPDIFLSGDTASWHTNKGTGGGFTENGALTDGNFTNPYGGLVGHWKLDETSGTTAADSSGNGNDGTLAGSLDLSNDSIAGPVGTAFNFIRNASDTITIPGSGSGTVLNLRTGDSITISTWIRPPTTPGFFEGAVCKGENPVQTNYCLKITGDRVEFWYNSTTGYESYTSNAGALTIGEWNHVVATHTFGTAGGATIYVDGVDAGGSWTQGTGGGTPVDFDDNLNISGETTTSNFFNGDIDDVRIYNRVLDTAEIAQLYNMGTPVGSSTALPANCPTIGDVCDDGTIYAGLSPDGSVAMFATSEDAPGTYAWNDNAGDYTDASSYDVDAGETNTNTIVTIDANSVTAGFQTHLASQYCYDLVSNGADDWYLPAINELELLYNSGDVIANIKTGSRYWSSSERNTGSPFNQSRTFNMSTGIFNNTNKINSNLVRCVRKGPAPRCANPYGMEGDVFYNTTHNVLQFCDGARWLAIGKDN